MVLPKYTFMVVQPDEGFGIKTEHVVINCNEQVILTESKTCLGVTVLNVKVPYCTMD
jgi:hypothetical protein